MKKLVITIGTFRQEYVLALTDAPKDFDYDGVIELFNYGVAVHLEHIQTKGPARMVLLPATNLEIQTMRNRSGLWVTWTEHVLEDTGILDRAVEQKLYQRLANPIQQT